jgi:hypothetical protein
MSGYALNQTLVQVAFWVIGQFLTTEDRSTIVTMLGILAAPDTAVETRYYLFTAIAKLAARFRCPDAVKLIFDDLVTDCNFEIQQRGARCDISSPIEGVWRSSSQYQTVCRPMTHRSRRWQRS